MSNGLQNGLDRGIAAGTFEGTRRGELSGVVGNDSGFRYDNDAMRFVLVAGIQNSIQILAINRLVLQLKRANIWTKMRAVYPFVGGTESSHKFNLKDPRDLDAAARLQFFGTWSHSSSGALPNGVNAYANTFLIPSTALRINDSHLSFYSRSNVGAINGCAIGSYNSTFTSANQILIRFADNNFYAAIDNSGFVTLPNNNTTGYYIANRTSSTDFRAYRNNLLMGFNSSPSVTLNDSSIFIGARSDRGIPVLYDNKQCAFASIGFGLTDVDVANLYNIVQRFQTILGRQV